MNAIYIFFPIDVYVRDFDARLLTALTILKGVDKIKIIIGSQLQVNKFILQDKSIKKMIYYEKGIDDRYSSWYRYLVDRGCLIYTLSEEGGIFEKNRHLVHFEIDEDNFDLIKKNFIWSNFIFDKFKNEKNSVFKHSEFLVTGNPRFDLCSYKFNNFYDDFLINYSKKKCIVISSTFSPGNTDLPDESHLVRLFSRKTFITREYWFDRERIKHCNKVRVHFIDLTKEIAIENPNIQIFFRPHPVEDQTIYKESFKGYKNILVNNSVPARDMIAISDVLIHHDCTTAIESYLNNKKPIAYLPIFNEKTTQEIPIRLSQVLTTINDVKNKIKKILNKKEDVNLPTKYLKYYLKNFEINSYERIAKTIITDIKNFDKLNFIKPKKKELKLFLLLFRSIALRSIRKIIAILRKIFLNRVTKIHKYHKITKLDEFTRKVESLSKIIGISKKVKIKELEENLFLLEEEL